MLPKAIAKRSGATRAAGEPRAEFEFGGFLINGWSKTRNVETRLMSEGNTRPCCTAIGARVA